MTMEQGVMIAKHFRSQRGLAFAALLLPVVLLTWPADAKDDRSRNQAPATVGSAPASSSERTARRPEVPIGHRQPIAADVPPDRPETADDIKLQKLNRELDGKLQICRGC